MSCGRVRRHGRAADGAGFARRRCACVAIDSECARERSACVADDPECARESSVCRAYRVGSRPVEREMALLDLIGRGFSYSISKTPSTRINANSVTWCFIREKPALLGKTEIEYEKAQRCGRAGECAGLVIGLDVGLHVVANAGAPLGGGGRYRVCAPDPACRGCVRGVPFDAQHSATGVDPRSARSRGDRGYDD